MYWMATFALMAFGFVAMFSVGRPFLLIGIGMLILGPLRRRPVFFWPPFAAVIAWNVAFMAIAPSVCTATQTIGAANAGGGSGESTTVCSSLIGITYRGTGIYNPSLEPANQAALVAAVLTFVLVLAATLAIDRTEAINGWLRAEQSRLPAIAAAGIGASVDAGYLLTVNSQGADFAPRVLFFAIFIAVLAGLSLAGAVVGSHRGPVAQALLCAATTGYLEAGGLALASIGIFLVLAGLLAFVAVGPRRPSASVVFTVVAAITGLFVAGILFT